MALIREDLTIPSVAEMFPKTQRRKNVKPCGTAAAYRRHFRHGEDELPVDPACAAWHAGYQRSRRRGRSQVG